MFPRVSRTAGSTTSWILTCIFVFTFAIGATPSIAATPGVAAGFEIDGNLVAGTSSAFDWYAASGGIGTGVLFRKDNPNPVLQCTAADALVTHFERDPSWAQGSSDITVFGATSDKNNSCIVLNQQPWNFKSGSGPQKNDISEAYLTVRTDDDPFSPTFGHKYLIMGVGHRETNGDNHVDFEYNQRGLRKIYNTGSTTTGIIIGGPGTEATCGRSIGDQIISVDFGNGGTNPTVSRHEWQQSAPGVFEYVQAPIGANFAAINTSAVEAPCDATQPSSKTLLGPNYEVNQFMEVAIDITASQIPDSVLCVSTSTMTFKTRSSESFTAELKDFVSFPFVILQPPPCNIAGPSAICQGNPFELCAPTGAGFTYLWSGDGIPAGEQTASCIHPTGLGVGSHSYQLTVFRSGCRSECATSVMVNLNPVANAGPDEAKCAAGATTPFTLAGTASGGTAVWAVVSGPVVIASPGSLTSGVTFTGIGTATLKLTVTSNSTPPCPPAEDLVVLTVNPNPVANAGPDEAKCAAGATTPFTLAGSASNGTAVWSVVSGPAVIADPASLTSGVTFTGIGTATLKLTTTSNFTPSCGSVEDLVVLVVNPNPVANAGPDEAKCAAGATTPFTLAGSASNGTAVWSVVSGPAVIANPASLTSGVTFTGVGTATLKLTTTSNFIPSCGSVEDLVVLTVNPNPLANAGPDQTKCAAGATTPFTLAGTASNGTTEWTVVSGPAVVLSPGSLTSGVTFTGIGTATLMLTTTSNFIPSCGSVEDLVVLTVNPNPVANAGPDQAKCAAGATTPFTLAGTASNGTAVWSVVSGPAAIADPSDLASGVTFTGVGTATLKLTTTSNFIPSCGSAEDLVVLTVNPNPVANAGPDQTKCAAGATTPFTLAGSASGGTSVWTVVSGPVVIASPGSLSSGVTFTGVGSATLKLTTTSNFIPSCGSAEDFVVLTVNPNPLANAGPDQTQCAAGATTPFTLAGTGSGGTVEWTVVSGPAVIADPSSLTSGVTFTGVGTATLKLTTTSTFIPSCGSVEDLVVLTVNPNPVADAGPDQAKCAAGATTPFTLAGSASGGSSVWTVVSGPVTIANPSDLASGVTFTGLGTATLKLKTTSGFTPSCGSAEDLVVLTVNPNPLANAGPDEAKCSTGAATSFTLAGSASNGTPLWSVVSGSVVIADPSNLATLVTVSGFGAVTLKLTTTSNFTPSCGTAEDLVVLTVDQCGAGCTPGFWQGGSGATLWNTVNDPNWTASGGVGTNPFIHTTLFNSFFTPHPNLVGLTMLDMVGSGGGSDPARKAARDIVAGYLNASFGINYPVSASNLAAQWTAAVAGGDAALTALHDLLAPFNQLGCNIAVQAPAVATRNGQPGGPLESQAPQISEIQMYRATPNPFSASTRIAFGIEGTSAQRVEIGVFDIAGRRIRSLVSSIASPGRYETSWDGSGDGGSRAVNGMYFVHIAIGTQQRTIRVLYMR